MVEKAPDFIDVTEVQFKLQSKVRIFNAEASAKPNCQLVATASAFGLIFVASPFPELKVIQLSSLTGDKISDDIPVRTIPLPSEASQIAVNCDNTLLAVDVVVNGITMILLYAVQSFLSQHPKALHSIRLSPDNGVRSKQLAWNPTLPGVLAVCLENGALSMFVLKEQGFEFHTVDKSQVISSVCWSPKGKQIVAGCPNGKLIQYKPDLKPIRVIDCPLEGQTGPLMAISIQWLSTYQFAVAFAGVNEPSAPFLYIVNAPKSGQISCVNYEDICYSGSGPRQTQVYLIHILPWNTLLMASANSMEVGVLATNEAGDAPVWRQWCMLDEARAELPLTAKKQESYPMGFCLETGCTHKLIIGEQEMPVMPMIHLLSTDGVLVSFNILNTIQNIPGICSPPRPLADTTGLSEFVVTPAAPTQQKPQIQPPTAASAPAAPAKEPEIAFSTEMAPGATSTPMVQQKSKGIFGVREPTAFGVPGQTPVSKPVATFGMSENVPKTGSSFGTPFGTVKPPPALVPVKAIPKPIPTTEPSKPFITVPPSYVASQAEKKPPVEKRPTVIPLDDENNAVIQKMMLEEVQAFEKDLSDLMKRSQNINTQIGSQETLSNMTKELRELTDLTDQATESTESLNADVMLLTMSLNEAFMMSAEAKSKWEVVSNPTFTNVNLMSGNNQTNRRQLNKLKATLSSNQMHMADINKQIDSIWVMHEEERNQHKKDRMRVPKMEVVYQTINVQREILMNHRKRLNEIKQKLDIKVNKAPSVQEIDSLSDSIVSLALVEEVKAETRKLDPSKMKLLQQSLKSHRVRTIHAKRPERKGINSEIVQEKREAAARVKQTTSSVPQQAFTFGGTLNPTPVKVIDPKTPPPVRPVAKAKQATTKHVSVVESKPTLVAPKATTRFEPAKPPLTSTVPTVPAIFPKSDVKSFVFGAAKAETEENKPPQLEVALGTKPTAPIATKPSVASPTVAALLTKSENSEPKSEQTKTPPFAFNIQKSPLGVFNQGNKAGPIFAPASTVVAPIPATSGGIFSQLAAASTAPTSIFSSLSSFGAVSQSDNAKVEKPTTVTTTSSVLNLSFGSGLTITPMAALEATVLSTPATSAAPVTITAKKEVETPKKEVTTTTTTIAKTTTTAAVTTSSAFDADNLLKNLTFCQPNVADKAPDAQPFSVFSIGGFGASTTATTTTSQSVFTTTPKATTQSIFGGSTAVTTAPATTSEPFKVQFGSLTVSSTPATTVQTTTSTSPPSGLFSSVIKSEGTPSPFGVQTTTTTSPFASLAISTTPSTVSPFGTSTTTSPFGTSGGSIFGSASGFQAQSGETSSVFGTPSQGNSSIFGGNSVFGQPTTPSSTPSIFGGGSPSTSSGSIFGGSATPTTSTPATFGSVFGGGQTTPQTQTSVFGGGVETPTGFGFGQQQQQQQQSSVFGSQSAFGRPSFGSPGGAFAQGGPSVAQSGFGSPNAFQKPTSTFGAAPTFGGPPTFGSSPTFGGAATFGSPIKSTGFGSFAATGSSFAAPPAQQQNNLFAALGSSDSGMTFGNLAQNNNGNQAKMQFGGSAFSTWRQ